MIIGPVKPLSSSWKLLFQYVISIYKPRFLNVSGWPNCKLQLQFATSSSIVDILGCSNPLFFFPVLNPVFFLESSCRFFDNLPSGFPERNQSISYGNSSLRHVGFLTTACQSFRLSDIWWVAMTLTIDQISFKT